MKMTGPLMISLEGAALSAKERELLLHPAVGGVILFSRNYNEKEQLFSLISGIREISPGLILAVDHEGGRVQRFREGFTRLPPMRLFGELFERDSQRALRLAYATGRLAAMELGEAGIHTGLSPVLDLAGASKVIGDRALHHSPEVVVKLARQLMLGMKDGGLLPVGKHFPGHGTAPGDTHRETVEDQRTLAQIMAADLQVFRELIADGTLPALMPAHVVYPRVDALSASVSRVWLKKILRSELGFDGIVISDDLAMSGIHAGGDQISAKRLFDAGCDMVLICNSLRLLQNTLEELPDNEVQRYARALGERWENVSRASATTSEKRPFDAGAAREELEFLYRMSS